MSEQKERNIDAIEWSEDESAKLEDLHQELRDHTAAFNPEEASEAEKVNFRRIRNAIYSRIKYRRRNRLMKTLSAQKADLERKNKLTRESNNKLEECIKIAASIADNQELPERLSHYPTQTTLPHTRPSTDPILAALERLRHGAQTNPSSSSNDYLSIWASELLSGNQTASQQQPFFQFVQQGYSQESTQEGWALLSLLKQATGERLSNHQSSSGTAVFPHHNVTAARNPTDSSSGFLEDLELHRALLGCHQEGAERAGSDEAFLDSLGRILGHRQYVEPRRRSALEMTLDLLSVEIFQLELDRRVPGNFDPQLASVLQVVVSKLLQFVDDLQRRSQTTHPEALTGEITMIRLCVDLMKSLGNPRNHPGHRLSPA